MQQEKWDHTLIIKTEMQIQDIIINGTATVRTSFSLLTLGSIEAAITATEFLQVSSVSLVPQVVPTLASGPASFSHHNKYGGYSPAYLLFYSLTLKEKATPPLF